MYCVINITVMASYGFFRDLREKAQSVIDAIDDSESDSESDSDSDSDSDIFQLTLDKLVEHILENWSDKAEAAAERGAFNTIIYHYSSTEIFNGHNISYLIEGPSDDSYDYDYWDRKGYRSVKQQIKNSVEVRGESRVEYSSGVITLYWDLDYGYLSY
jgi:hypothetical protein